MRKLLTYCTLQVAGNRMASGVRRSHQLDYFRFLKDAQWNSLAENIDAQKRALYDLLLFAIRRVPYYKGLGFSEKDFSSDTIFEDVQKFPILTKDIIRREGANLYPTPDIADWTFHNVSGGTTGEPVPFRHSGTFFDFEQGAKLLYDEWAGRKIGDSQIRLWGSERDIISGKKDWLNKLYRWTRNEEFLNTFRMSEEDMRRYIDRINEVKPKMILAYVQSAFEIANFARMHNLKIHPPQGLMTSAGTLTSPVKKVLTETFSCPVLNRYGSREMGDMACSCEKDEGLHINVFSCYLEVVDERGKQCGFGADGEFLTTLLKDYSMPIIRYAIGDFGHLIDHPCSCGRGLPMIGQVTGRIVDIFKTRERGRVDGEYFTHLFYECKNIKQFQVVQDQIDHLTVKLVFFDRQAGMSDDAFYCAYVENTKKAMGADVRVDFQIVDDIPVSPSGKRAYTICGI